MKDKNMSWGEYFDDGEGNQVYVKDGEKISVLSWLWKKVGSDISWDYIWEDFYNESTWVITTIRRNKNTWEETVTTRGINGQEWSDYVDNLGTGQITSYGWVHDRWEGLDIDVKMLDPVYAPFDWTIVEATSSAWYGVNIVIEDEGWNRVRFSHLDPSMLYKWGTRFEKGAIIAKAGNTGNVLKMDWTKPSAKELKAWFGSHLDIVSYKPDWTARKSRETEDFLRNYSKKDDASYKEENWPLYASYNNKRLTTAEINTIGDFETFKKEAIAYGKEKALPWYETIENLVTLANGLKETPRAERMTNFDTRADISRLTSKAGMQELISLKWEGATFGSLTEWEFQRIQESILLINNFMSADKMDEILDDYIVSLTKWLPTDRRDALRSGKTTANSSTVSVNGKDVNFSKYTWWNTTANAIDNLYSN
jgi:hypothetical protein